MHSIKELQDILGYSSDQLRLRLDRLKPILSETVKRGDNNKILVTDNGLEILKRSKQLEERDIPLTQIPNRLRDEMGKTDDDASDDLAQADPNLIEEKDKRISDLLDRVEELKTDKQYWREQAEELQQKLITGEVEVEEEEEEEGGVVKRLLRWIW
ncbi:MAG: hypothetical protein ACLFVS_03240 [Candidatus Acetothermia bacterium]